MSLHSAVIDNAPTDPMLGLPRRAASQEARVLLGRGLALLSSAIEAERTGNIVTARILLRQASTAVARSWVAGMDDAAVQKLARRLRDAVDAGKMPEPFVWIDTEARCFSAPGSPSIMISDEPLQRIFAALVAHLQRDPGQKLSIGEITRIGFGPDRTNEAGVDAIRRLRHWGLDAILVESDDGCALDPSRCIVIDC